MTIPDQPSCFTRPLDICVSVCRVTDLISLPRPIKINYSEVWGFARWIFPNHNIVSTKISMNMFLIFEPERCFEEPSLGDHDLGLQHLKWGIDVTFARRMGQGTPWYMQLVHPPPWQYHTAWEPVHELPNASGWLADIGQRRAWQILWYWGRKTSWELQERLADPHGPTWTQRWVRPFHLAVESGYMSYICEG